jgi:hypothetical protein
MRTPRLDLIGQRFGRLTVTGDWEVRKKGKRYWRCVCQCGQTTWVLTAHLTRKGVTSCGCFRRELTGTKSRKGPADFWAKVQKLPDGCWLWLGSRNKRYGYFKGAHIHAHKYAYELMIGPVPDGLELDHLCRNRYRVNPSHLEAVPHQINVARGASTKITYEAAVQIALRRFRGEKYSVIAKDYGVAESTVRDIANGKRPKGARITAAFLFDLEKES